ncbi:MAG: pyridoxamine 5'-phosphate oxidase family protein [Candidatus Gastranaerophilales bacterium]|nr:pyridoxamine 5'-phosphate oxidase family protein [Candidatus Gastranaerophilales bacterium]
MFRPMRRIKQQLSQEECDKVLNSELRGVLSVLGDNDYPYGIPIDFLYSKEENKIYFHGSSKGHKIDSILKHNKVSFSCYDKGTRTESKTGLDFKSVIAFGRIKIVEDREKTVKICRKLAERFNFDKKHVEDEIKKYANFVTCLELNIEHITGKLVNES